jgi:MFS family permease
MMIETAQMQRLIVMLGHPTYGLSVVLFTLLLSSGLGSQLTGRVGTAALGRSGVSRLTTLLIVLVATGLATAWIAPMFDAAATPARITMAVLLLFPSGVFMGMAFPLGMKLAAERSPALTPWLWGINGAFSVCASVLAIVVALATTISTAYWAGTAAYVVALLAFARATRTTRARAGVPV